MNWGYLKFFMSIIEKLYIKGVRSFDPTSGEALIFYTPLTLIVGHNGAGKTTIIECLKYATTGEMPPNSKNAAFVHDPKMANQSEVKAQVKLRFRNVNNEEVVCTRSMVATQTASKLSFKSLEQVLLIRDPETMKQHSLSTRCAEIDQEMPNHLGVSKSILENVIFCHQEDSFWPLLESSVLKKKFDEIFAATRYSKALVNLKDLKKAYNAKLSNAELQVGHLKENKQKSERVASTIQDLETQIENHKKRIRDLDDCDIVKINESITLLKEQRESLWFFKNKLDQLILEKDMNSRNISSLSENLQIFQESDEELARLHEIHYTTLHQHDSNEDALTSKREQSKRSLEHTGQLLNTNLSKLGQLRAEQAQHAKQLEDRRLVAIEAAACLGMNDLSGSNIEDSKISTVISNLKQENQRIQEELILKKV
jgi:DNA repair protein RAD50